MKIKTTIIAGILGAVLLPSCERTAPISIFEKKDIPQTIEDDFYVRHEDAVVTDASVWSYDGHVSIYFKDANRLSCEATYQDGEWVMTTRDLGEHSFLTYVPSAVRQSFIDLGYRTPRFDITDNTNRVYEITRQGIDHQVYDFRFHIELENGSFTPIQVMINEDGMLLLDSRLGYNRQELFHWSDDTPYSIIYDRCPGADVRSYANYAGHHHFYVVHDGRLKTMELDGYSGEWDWRETVYELDADTVIPETILNVYEQWKIENAKYADSSYDRILYKETKTGDFFGLQDTKREDGILLWVRVR